ncbi:hypothetical protein [Aromatoleum evansii]|uniref:hypothetical protein n=1 Tax=Aromatoleum evansii TaxID=59406 RepID=UPI00145E5871|nr:hypothetical protein [Aromatoleum evansii]NMG31887.1 hypothetical protein [Aromatoleum evansii]
MRLLHLAAMVLGAHLAVPTMAMEGKFNHRDPLGLAKKREARDLPLNIEVAPGDWGKASTQDIQVFLDAVAREFLAAVDSPRAGELTIRVVPRAGSPKVLYEQRSDGEYVIQLTARDERWYQYAYQFAHELCHVFTNFDHKAQSAERVAEHNQWFEESLCETASLFVLQQLAVKWASSAPTKNWLGYDQALAGYARRLLSERHRYLAADQSFPAWFAARQASLQSNPYAREDNELVATTLLPLFEAHPEYWQAIKYLNPDKASAGKPFADYLHDWLAASPDKRLPREILALFGLAGEASPTVAERGGKASTTQETAGAQPSARVAGGPAGPRGDR